MWQATPAAAPEAVRSAAAIAAEIRQNADFGEAAGYLAPQSVALLKSSGMLSLWRPRSLGGEEADPLTYALAAEEIAAADSAAAWLMHGVSATWFDLRGAAAELVDEIVASAEVPVLAETYNKPMRAEAVEGGYRVSGTTPFASGCVLADWLGHTALAGDRFLLMYHPKGTLEVEADWDSLGMRGTASNTIVADAIFVPEHRVIDHSTPPRRSERFAATLYDMPAGIIPVAVAAVSLGVLRAALGAVTEIAERKTPFAATTTLKHRPLAQLHFGRALAIYRAARSFLHSSLVGATERARRGEAFDMRDKADLFLAYAHVLQSSAEAVGLLARAVGTAAIYKGRGIERALRDIEVISHHAFGAEGRYLSVAQAYWDVEIDFPMLAMD